MINHKIDSIELSNPRKSSKKIINDILKYSGLKNITTTILMTDKTTIQPSASTPETSETANTCKKIVLIVKYSKMTFIKTDSDNITTSDAMLGSSSVSSAIEATTGENCLVCVNQIPRINIPFRTYVLQE